MEEFVVAAIGKEVLFNEGILRAGFDNICLNNVKGSYKVEKDQDYFTIPQLKDFVKKEIDPD